MKTVEIVVSVLFILGGIALVITIVKYPKDIAKGIFIGIPRLFLSRIWDFIVIIAIPIWLPLSFLDSYYDWGLFDKFRNRTGSDDEEYEGTAKKISFGEYRKYILTTEKDTQIIEKNLIEASETISELDISDYKIEGRDDFTIIEVPASGFYGFNFLVQWFDSELRKKDVFGYASDSNGSFFLYQDKRTTNSLIGKTNQGKSFSVSMYDDLDKTSSLNMNDRIKIDKKVTTEFLKEQLEHPT